MTVSHLILKAAKIAGSETKLGEKCGFSQNAVWQARRNGRVTAEMAVAIHQATDGQVAKWELRPDLWELPHTPSQHTRGAAA